MHIALGGERLRSFDTAETPSSVSVYSRGDSKEENEGCNILQIVSDFPLSGKTAGMLA
jgi:hypothetical protein